MRAHDIPHVVRHLLEKHGLLREGWTFAWDNARRRCGCCRYHRKQITLSRHYVELNVAANLDDVIDTVLHEIAHALVGPDHGHDDAWKSMCVTIGARPQRCADTSIVLTPGRLVAHCPKCGKEYCKNRIVRNRHYYCRPCGQDAGRLVFSSREGTAPAAVPTTLITDVPSPQPRRLRGV